MINTSGKFKGIYSIILIVSALIILGAILFNVQNLKKVEESSTIDASQPVPEYQYIMKEYNGKLAVFEIDKDQPKIVFDVLVSTLPELDVIQLQSGLKIKDIHELNQRIEDFIS